MFDLLFVAMTVLFSLVSIGYVAASDPKRRPRTLTARTATPPAENSPILT